MARKQVVQYIDDLDGRELSEEEVVTIRFSVNNANYVLDLSTENAQHFNETLDPFVRNAQRETATTRRNTRPSGPNSRVVREWAKEQGFEVADRGKIPSEIIEAFITANPSRR